MNKAAFKMNFVKIKISSSEKLYCECREKSLSLESVELIGMAWQ